MEQGWTDLGALPIGTVTVIESGMYIAPAKATSTFVIAKLIKLLAVRHI